jgi:hypothetical protein
MTIQHLEINKKDIAKSVSIVTIDDVNVEVKWWYSLTFSFNEQEVSDFLQAEALVILGREEEAVSLLQPKASGTITKEIKTDGEGFEYTETTDTRNWYQRWIDEHPIV